MVTGCLCPTSTDNLLILAGIQPAKLCCLGATLRLTNRSILDRKHLLDDHLVRPLDLRQERLKSRRPFVPAAWKLLDNASKLDIRVGKWTDFTWSTEYLHSSSKLQNFIPRVGFRPLLNWAWLGKTQPLANWLWAFSIILARMGSCFLL